MFRCHRGVHVRRRIFSLSPPINIPFCARGLRTGIVGLPNVGKSTLFNALIGNNQAAAENYPFCTIEPNTGLVPVPDQRLEVLGKLNKSEKVVPTIMEFVDIAGIVKGAHKGEGLGNKFLSNIRQTDAIVHVVRCFEDINIIHVDETVNPLRDIDVINLELVLADVAQVEKRMAKALKDVKQKKADPAEITALEKIDKALSDGLPARAVELTGGESESIKGLMLLTMKKVIYAANVPDTDLGTGNKLSDSVRDLAVKENSPFVLVSAQVESELSGFDLDERKEYMEQLGVSDESFGLPSLVKAAYSTLGLQTYYTSGPTETRAWTIKKGSTAPQAAGVIHSDFEKGFIRAEITPYDDMVACGSEKNAKENGKVKSEGKDYVMADGDVALFRFN